MKDKLVYAASIQERADILSLYYKDTNVKDNLSKWMSRKSLCTEELFDLSLQEKQMERKSFNLAIKSLDSNDIEVISKEIKRMIWYKKAHEILEDDKAYSTTPDIIDFSYAIRPFLYYLKKQIEQIKAIGFTISDVEAFYIHLGQEFIQIAAKTLVYDLYEQKKKFAFKGKTSNDRFVYYMIKRFGQKTSLMEFYEDYPVLLRLLTERVLFHADNFKEFIRSIKESLPDFEKTFSLSKPYRLSNISVGAGDSHGKGKSVILFDLNDQRFAFKYKNLEIGERFNSFLEYIERQTGKEFFKIKRIIKRNYCIEEFVQRKEVKSEEDIRKFYHRFGEYVALAYLLCGNDFHYENLIAHGGFPVLIDIETLIQNDSPIKYADNPYVSLSLKKFNSVLGSALLPFKVYGNRIEPIAEGGSKGQGIRISAFDGKKQKSPYKGLSLINENTDEVRFDYVEYELEGANNIPVFNGKEVDAEKYKYEVVEGFKEICTYFLNNKYKLISVVENIFSNVIVRNVIKTTQKYVDMLGYGYHPKCMMDYIEREKLFENLWAFEYKNKSAILSEIKDLLVNDVPIFFNNTSAKDLITSDGKVIKEYYLQTAIEHVKNRIISFSNNEYLYQKLRLELSLGIYKQEIARFYMGDSVSTALEKIINIIHNRAIYDEKSNQVAFEDFIYESDGTLDYNALNAEFYDGLSGIYIFVLYYAKRYPDEKIKLLKSALEKSLFKLPNKKAEYHTLSAYIGKYSLLYPLYHKYKLEGNDEDLLLAENLIKEIEYEIGENVEADWLNGVSGLIQVLINYYKLTKKTSFLKKAEVLSTVWNKKEIKFCGFAHGFSGIIYAAYSLYCETGKENYSKRVEEYLFLEDQYIKGKIWPDLREGKNATSHWCHGTIGIGLTRLYLLKHGYQNEQVWKDFLYCLEDALSTKCKETGLCHGEMGRFLFLKEAQQLKSVPKYLQNKIDKSLREILQDVLENGIVIGAFEKQCILGLMTGITGIGYGLLKEAEINIPNILCLE